MLISVAAVALVASAGVNAKLSQPSNRTQASDSDRGTSQTEEAAPVVQLTRTRRSGRNYVSIPGTTFRGAEVATLNTQTTGAGQFAGQGPHLSAPLVLPDGVKVDAVECTFAVEPKNYLKRVNTEVDFESVRLSDGVYKRHATAMVGHTTAGMRSVNATFKPRKIDNFKRAYAVRVRISSVGIDGKSGTQHSAGLVGCTVAYVD